MLRLAIALVMLAVACSGCRYSERRAIELGERVRNRHAELAALPEPEKYAYLADPGALPPLAPPPDPADYTTRK